MLRLLIADDEKMIRESISTLIDWKSLNIEVVAVCKNGLEAYDAILDKYPDIVLTDIQMPKLSGLELIQKITQNHDNIQFIILSGYNDFSYAKEAMGYGIKHYILKPCSENEIISAVKEAVKDHYRQVEVRNLYQDPGSLHFNEILFYDMLLHMLSSDQPLSKTADTYETYVDFYHTGYYLYYLFFIEESCLPGCLEQIRRLTQARQIPYIYTFIYVTNTLLFFFPDDSRDDFDEVDSILVEHISMLADNSPQSSYKREHFLNMADMLDTLRNKVRRYASIHLYSSTQDLVIRNYDSLSLEISALTDRLFKAETGELDRITDTLRKLLLSVTCLEFLRSISGSLLLQALHLSNFYTMNDIMGFLMSLSKMDDLNTICEFVIGKLRRARTTNLGENKPYKSFIQDVLNYTEEHLSSPELTLKWIAENHLYMNVDYVSRQFVLQTGVRFSTYLNELRIKKAKELLLKSGNEKIYSIAEQVGCGNNPQYFSHLFKKYTHMSPKEYIKKMKMEDGEHPGE